MKWAAAVRAPSGGASDEPRFEALYRRHIHFVWRSLRVLGVPPASVEDAAHEVFLVVHRRLADYDGRAKVTTWIYGIALGVARNHRRSHRRAERRLAAVGEASPSLRLSACEHADPAHQLDRRQAANLVSAFLSTLDDRKRIVFELCEVEGLSAPAAARCLALNVNTITTRLRRARARFARYVAQLQAGEP